MCGCAEGDRADAPAAKTVADDGLTAVSRCEGLEAPLVAPWATREDAATAAYEAAPPVMGDARWRPPPMRLA